MLTFGFFSVIVSKRKIRKTLFMMILVTFNNRVSVSLLEDDCWQFFKRGIYLLPDSWAFEPD